MNKKIPPPFYPWHPKYGVAWLLTAVLYLLCFLPYRIQLWLGCALGKFAYHVAKRERRVAKINIDLCFPNLLESQRQSMLKKHFTSLGISVFEIGLARWIGPKRLSRLIGHIEGVENVDQAIQQEKGIILPAPHFTCIQICARMFSLYHPVSIFYRPHKKLFINYFFEKIYHKTAGMIPRHDIRQLICALKKEKRIVCFTPDVDTGRKSSVFVPFFNIPTATTITPAVISRLASAIVIPICCYRLDNSKGYSLHLGKPLKGFPSDNIEKDITTINQYVERYINKCPEQYLWSYKRFKTRPVGEKRFY